MKSIQGEIRGTLSVICRRIPLPTRAGYDFIPLDQITHCRSEGNYSYIVLLDSTKILLTLKLKDLEILLATSYFYRIHHQIIVNLNHIIRFEKKDGGSLILSNNISLPISRVRKKDFISKLKLPF